LILTDGAITDTRETLRAIVQASMLPMSIIIVGIGSAEFDTMEMLDGDGKLLKDDQNNTCVRDCVQFVPFRNYTNRNLFCHDVLFELPVQIMEYYKWKNIKPEDLNKRI